jgi:uncharacterized protein (DUF1800 family)
MPDLADIEHLLRRTEYVARPERVDELMALPTRAAAIDDILDVPSNPPSVTFTATNEFQRGDELARFWLDRMAHDSPRPLQEKMGFFWHGHFCSDLRKAVFATLMREQIDLFRRRGLGKLRTLARSMSTQVAMLRYLDNNQNQRTSPNQNFARELLELFLLGVGNYTEADVEAATAAWTGHSDDELSGSYVWRADWHDGLPKQFLGRTINAAGTDPRRHGRETIDVVLGNGVVPVGPNAGRPSRTVAAEFVSRKLWIEFAGTDPSPAVLGALRNAALDNDFALRPWLRRLLDHDEFYAPAVRRGLVRSPVEFVVAILVATGRRAAEAAPLWRMEGMGQRPLFPPNVAGWKHNGYWVNAGAMAKRTEATLIAERESMLGYASGDGRVHLGRGSITKTQIESTWAAQPGTLLDRMLELMDVALDASSYGVMLDLAQQLSPAQRTDLVHMIMLTPEFQLA